jgi:hypothetical protein
MGRSRCTAIRDDSKGKTSMLATLKAWCLHSLTIAWAYVLVAAGALVEIVPPALDLVNSPEAAETIRSVIPANYMGAYTIAIGVLTFAARMRSLASNPAQAPPVDAIEPEAKE